MNREHFDSPAFPVPTQGLGQRGTVRAAPHLDPAAQAERHAAIRLLNHIHVVDRIFAAHLSGAAHGYYATNTPKTPTLDELAVAVEGRDRWYVALHGRGCLRDG